HKSLPPSYPLGGNPQSLVKCSLAGAYLSRQASVWASKCALGTSIRLVTRGCRGMRAARWARSTATTACMCFPIATRISSARSRSTCTLCGSPRASFGASRHHRAMAFISICGTTTLSQPDQSLLPHEAGGPVFAEPWQAQAFALAVKLSEQGHFTWKEWAAALADELKAAADRGDPD